MNPAQTDLESGLEKTFSQPETLPYDRGDNNGTYTTEVFNYSSDDNANHLSGSFSNNQHASQSCSNSSRMPSLVTKVLFQPEKCDVYDYQSPLLAGRV